MKLHCLKRLLLIYKEEDGKNVWVTLFILKVLKFIDIISTHVFIFKLLFTIGITQGWPNFLLVINHDLLNIYFTQWRG